LRMSLTARQAAVLQVIRDFSKRGYSPRLTEIRDAVGLRGVRSVELHVKTLERLGYLLPRPKGQHRSIALAEPMNSAA
jgi:SOS-response transcriptional repressor LexA